MDALLGAAALGDIGAWFPPGDDAYAGANSAGLARKVASGLRDRGYEVVNLDLTVLAEAPRIRERVEEMRRSIAACLGIGIERIGLKATTLEGIGALGRGEGIACQATALISAAKVVS
jgi:2-C-methyl-D-erythritol 2,4-cyclodiphosphate synthase